MPEQILMKLGMHMHIMEPEPISTAYFINPSHQSLCLYVRPSMVAVPWLSKNVTTASNTHTTTEELCRPYSIKGK
jgi:hypothetical protein